MNWLRKLITAEIHKVLATTQSDWHPLVRVFDRERAKLRAEIDAVKAEIAAFKAKL